MGQRLELVLGLLLAFERKVGFLLEAAAKGDGVCRLAPFPAEAAHLRRDLVLV